MNARDRLTAAFDEQVHLAAIARHKHRLADPGFWRELAPHLSITETPFPRRPPPIAAPAHVRESLTREGYFAVEGLFSRAGTPVIFRDFPFQISRNALRCSRR